MVVGLCRAVVRLERSRYVCSVITSAADLQSGVVGLWSGAVGCRGVSLVVCGVVWKAWGWLDALVLL